MTRPSLTDLNPDKYNQGLRYCQFIINLDICSGIFNSFDNPSGKICNPSKPEDIYLSAFNVMVRINESQTLMLLRVQKSEKK